MKANIKAPVIVTAVLIVTALIISLTMERVFAPAPGMPDNDETRVLYEKDNTEAADAVKAGETEILAAIGNGNAAQEDGAAIEEGEETLNEEVKYMDISSACALVYVIPVSEQGSQEDKIAWVRERISERTGTAVTVETSNGIFKADGEIISKVTEAGKYANIPFGSQNRDFAYANDLIMLKDHIPQTVLDAETGRLYDEWRDRYVKRDKYNPDQAYVDWSPKADWGSTGITVSEGHGYGMMVLALMAGYDDDTHRLFDDMTRFYLAHTSKNDSLLQWKQDYVNGRTVSIEGVDSNATDGDLDVAYALLLADAQWGTSVCGTFTYRELAEKLLNDIMRLMVLRGSAGNEYWLLRAGRFMNAGETRPSDFMLQHFHEFAAFTGDRDWLTLNEYIHDAVVSLVAGYSPGTGLIPDFAAYDRRSGEWSTGGRNYGYDACRVPWRLSMEYIMQGETGVWNELTLLNNWVRNMTKGNPANIKANYRLDGSFTGNWSDPSFVAPFMLSAMLPTEGNNPDWLVSLWNWNISRDTHGWWSGYFDNCIRLLAAITVSGNWISPSDFVTGPVTEDGYKGRPVTQISGFDIKNDSGGTVKNINGGTTDSPRYKTAKEAAEAFARMYYWAFIKDDGTTVNVIRWRELDPENNPYDPETPGEYGFIADLRDLPDRFGNEAGHEAVVYLVIN